MQSMLKRRAARRCPTLCRMRKVWVFDDFCRYHTSASCRPLARAFGARRVAVPGRARALRVTGESTQSARAFRNARGCMDHRPRMPSEGLQMAPSCAETAFWSPLKLWSLLVAARNALRALVSRRLWRHLGRLEDGTKNGPFWAAERPAGHWRERVEGHFLCIFWRFTLMASRWPKMAQKSQNAWPAPSVFYSFFDVGRSRLHCLPRGLTFSGSAASLQNGFFPQPKLASRFPPPAHEPRAPTETSLRTLPNLHPRSPLLPGVGRQPMKICYIFVISLIVRCVLRYGYHAAYARSM